MENKVLSPKERRQRKFLLVFPLLVLPFMTMAFWALGGGKGADPQAQTTEQNGFNLHLPDADLHDKPMDKMSYYDQAQTDSLKFQELVRNDPSYQNSRSSDINEDAVLTAESYGRLNASVYGNQDGNDASTDKIYRKLADLDKEMNRRTSSPTADGASNYQGINGRRNNDVTVSATEVDRLEEMMQMMNQPAGEDPELKQLDGMLDKILAVQHPGRVLEKTEQVSKPDQGRVFAISAHAEDNGITLLNGGHLKSTSANGFYSLTGAIATDNAQNAIQAFIHETQTIVDGATVKLRLVNDVFIDGAHIPKDHFLFGIASLNGERLNIEIKSIRFNQSLLPVSLSVYDMDGISGIHIPGAITRDVAKQSADRSLQTIGLGTLDPSLGAQAASAGIEAAKTLFSRKVKLVKVTVKAGYRVLLYDGKQKLSN